MSPTGSESWTEILDKTLEDSRKTEDPLQLQWFPLENEVTSQFIKFELLTWWGWGGGLQYFDILRKGETAPLLPTKPSPGQDGSNKPKPGKKCCTYKNSFRLITCFQQFHFIITSWESTDPLKLLCLSHT